MSTFNHSNTAADGGIMVAADVTAPDNALDAAIGDLTTLTTTNKTSVVAALLEMLANSWVTTTRIANLAVTTAKIAAGAVTTTELGANAVTTAKLAASAVTATELASSAVTTAKLNNLAVTGAKIATDAFAPPNVFMDATFQTTPLKIAAEWGIAGHTFRWHPRTQAGLDDTAMFVFDDTANPMGVRQRTLRFKGTSASTVFGWYISLAEAGWKAGDVISGEVYGMAAAGTFALNVRCYNAAGTALGSVQAGTGLVFTGTPALISISGATVDAGAAYVLFYISRTAGSNNFDPYWRWAGPGIMLPAVPSGQGYLPQQGVPRKHADDAVFLLPDYAAQANKILSADGTSQLDVVYLSDSWGQRKDITTALRSFLQTSYGDAGLGWVSFYVTFNQGSAYWEGLSTAGGATQRTGTWAPGDSSQLATSRGPDITHVATTDSAATMKLTTTVSFTDLDILAYNQPTAGKFDYRIDGGGWVTVDTNAAAGVNVTTVTGLASTTHVIEFQINTLATLGLTFLGLNLRRQGNGARLHRLSTAGADAAEWASVNAATWQAGLAVLTPNTVIISLGTNDKTTNVPPQTHANSLYTVISRIWATRALTDILIFSPCDVVDNGGTTYTTAQYASAQRTLAASLDVAYADGFALVPVNADGISRGVMEVLSGGNSRHPTPAGGRMLGNWLAARFFRIF